MGAPQLYPALPPKILKSTFTILFWRNFLWNIFMRTILKIVTNGTPSHLKIFINYPFIKKFCMKNPYLNVSWWLGNNWKKIHMGVSIPPLKLWNLHLLFNFDTILYETPLIKHNYHSHTCTALVSLLVRV